MRTNVIKVLVVFGMSVRELRAGVKARKYNKEVLRNADMLMSTLMIERASWSA